MRFLLLGCVASPGHEVESVSVAAFEDADVSRSPDVGGRSIDDATVSDATGIGPASSSPDAGPASGVFNPYAPRRQNRRCRLPEPPPIAGYESERAFTALDFDRPLWIGSPPGDPETMVVMEQGGRIFAFDNRADVGEAELFLNLAVSRAGNEEGLLGLAFHPDYESNGRFFVYYSARGGPCPPGSRRCSVISEFLRQSRRAADVQSERPLLVIPQPYSNHNGGDLHFGPDGHLYISVGDGGSGGDPLRHGQNQSTLLGTILRIDVDGDAPYAIPADNPFADGSQGRPEIWAWGLRNAWRMSFDPSTGVLWSGDVGQNRWEEVNRMTGPGNYGWRTVEGHECFIDSGCDRSGLISPVHVYDHSAGESVTGGVVYRGARLPELWGKYLFADYESRQVWALDADAMPPIRSNRIAIQSQISSFGVDARGDVYMTTFERGKPIVRLRRVNPDQATTPFPERLSQTGCFSDVQAHRMAEGVIPYRVNVPFWSDGLNKLRFVALPDGTRASYRPVGGFEMPVGSVLIKTFVTPDTSATPNRRIETRMYARFDAGWRGFSWRWNEAQTDAILVEENTRVQWTDGGTDYEWEIPSRVQCDQCHTAASGYTLGWSARQLNGVLQQNGQSYDQLRSLADAGYLDVPDRQDVPAHPRMDGDANIASKARAALDVNCAPCHQPNGGANATMDLRAHIPLSVTRACDEVPQQGALSLSAARIIAPGAPERSVLIERMKRLDGERMPPIGSHRIDLETVDLLNEWVTSLSRCR